MRNGGGRGAEPLPRGAGQGGPRAGRGQRQCLGAEGGQCVGRAKSRGRPVRGAGQGWAKSRGRAAAAPSGVPSVPREAGAGSRHLCHYRELRVVPCPGTCYRSRRSAGRLGHYLTAQRRSLAWRFVAETICELQKIKLKYEKVKAGSMAVVPEQREVRSAPLQAVHPRLVTAREQAENSIQSEGNNEPMDIRNQTSLPCHPAQQRHLDGKHKGGVTHGMCCPCGCG